MPSLGCESGSGNAFTSQHQSQIPNLNPSARPFTPTESARSPATTPGFRDLAYHQIKAVEAANILVAKVLPHLGCRFDRERTSEQAYQKIHTEHVRQTEHATQKSFDWPQSVHSAGLSAGLDAPKTPPNRRIKTRKMSPTPAAHTFDDDDDFYPGADPHLVRKVCG
ncbi:uncharacterized protein GLRG_10283 [Colletotrichum graminicola M1.001]|uniref:Uncharacterized protein n=1 Tax=Colletotrichum graminicola (strain M1.001 / M2 / FGSC 10212) TaxID=645133 RepID=E3QWA5_COLGM|nr:uncharacterized protein GLRG_10283 [Colletotrichum graminicola M1.001]EFQ35139.1 hypothetical protein GLRG_10283 [Colletotrichum graminicola M1.001]